MTTLTEFLLARIEADEGGVRELHGLTCSDLDEFRFYGTNELPCDCKYPARVLAECAAKRAIVELHQGECCIRDWDHDDDSPWHPVYWTRTAPCPTLRHLASIYADHPDYREAWRP